MPTKQTLGIDLGRHRVFVVRGDASTNALFPMQADHNGLVFRWIGPDGVERVLDYLQALPPEKANVVSSEICEMLVDRIRTIDPESLNDSVMVSCPVGASSTVASQLVTGFQQAGIFPLRQNFVERPITSLANWLAQRRSNGTEGDQPILALDNDAGQMSALIADPSTRRLLAMGRLSADLTEGRNSVGSALESLLARASYVYARFPNQQDLINSLNSPTEELIIGDVVLSGMNTDHPDLSSLAAQAAPEAKTWGRNSDAELVTAFGLLHMNELRGWTCPWPTGYVLLDNKVAVEPGPIPLLAKGQGYSGEIRIKATEDAIIRVTDADGRARPTQLRGEDGVGLRLPSRLGSYVTVTIGSDGKISFNGDTKSRPLVIQPYWPVAGTPSTSTKVDIVRRAKMTAQVPDIE